MDAASEAEWSALTYAHHRTAASAAAPGATFIGRMDNLAQTLVGAALGRAVALDRGPGRGDRGGSSLARLAGLLRRASAPPLEHPLVLRRLDRDRGPVLLDRAAPRARLGRAAPLAPGARVHRHAARRHRAGRVGGTPDTRALGAARRARRRHVRGGLDAALVRRRPPEGGGGIRAARPRGVRRGGRRRERGGESLGARHGDPALRPRGAMGGARRGRPPLSPGADLRRGRHGGGARLGRAAPSHAPGRGAGACHAGGAQHRAARALPGRGSRPQRERAAGVPAGRSRPHRGPPGMGGRGGQAAMTQVVPADLQDTLARVLGAAFRLDRVAALSAERALYQAWDRILKRHVALLVHLAAESSGRAWFMHETETLAALDHPAIRHVYAAAVAEGLAYRTANWIEGESLAEALRRGPRPIPTAHVLVRDLLGALEHAHARGVILRRIVPMSLMLGISGRAVITIVRYAHGGLA